MDYIEYLGRVFQMCILDPIQEMTNTCTADILKLTPKQPSGVKILKSKRQARIF